MKDYEMWATFGNKIPKLRDEILEFYFDGKISQSQVDELWGLLQEQIDRCASERLI